MHVGIIGGGILGVTLGYFLSGKGVRVTIFEASDTLGGRASPLKVDGCDIDRFYQPILPGDARLAHLCSRLGLIGRLRFGEAKTALYHEGRLHPTTTPKELLTFPPLGWIDRVRLGLTVASAGRVRDWHALESVSAETWLTRTGGRRAFDTVWRPLLSARFDGGFEGRPATVIWALLNRLLSARAGSLHGGVAGYLIGGYGALIEAMAERIRMAGGAIRLNCPALEIAVREGQLAGLRTLDGTCEFDAIVATLQTPTFLRLTPGIASDYRDSAGETDYLGMVSVLLALDRPLTGYWMLDIADDGIPFTHIAETTRCIDPRHTGGNHLVYLSRYSLPNSRWLKMSERDVRETWLRQVEQMFPEFRREWIRHVFVERERLAEPIYPLNAADHIPPIQTPVKNLYLANTGQIYPEPTSGESITCLARRAAKTILDGAQPRVQLISNGALAAWHAARRVPPHAFEGLALSTVEGPLLPGPLGLGSAVEEPVLRSPRLKGVGSVVEGPALSVVEGSSLP